MSTLVKCLSIMQPWPFLIFHAGKDVENREWSTNYRGRILIHAGKKPDPRCYNSARGRFVKPRISAPIPADFEERASYECPNRMGGIVGAATLVDVVHTSTSPWFVGSYGFVLQDAMELPFMPYPGKPALFDVDFDLVLASMRDHCFCCERREVPDETLSWLACQCLQGRCTGCGKCGKHCRCIAKAEGMVSV